MTPEKLVELDPKEWSSDHPAHPAPPSRARYTLKIFCMALALSALWNFHSLVKAVSSFYDPPPNHSVVAPGSYAWTPEHGLQPLTTDSPATQPRH